MSRSIGTCFIVGTLLWTAGAASACRGCRSEPPTATTPAAPAASTAKPDPSGKPPNIKMDYGKALEDLHNAMGRKPEDCKPGTGPNATQKRADGTYAPCEPTEAFLKRLEEMQKRGRAH